MEHVVLLHKLVAQTRDSLKNHVTNGMSVVDVKLEIRGIAPQGHSGLCHTYAIINKAVL